MAFTASDISIKLDGVDITDQVVFSETSFTSQSNPIAGTFRLSVTDPDQTFSPTLGEKVTCHIDGFPIFGGYLMNIAREHFFPAVDTTTPGAVKTRKWVLSGPDFNILFDKRVLRKDDAYDKAPKVPVGKRRITKAFRHLMNTYIDIPPGLNWRARVDWITTKYGSDKHGGLYVGLGKTWREQMDDFADNAGLIYYIDADFYLNMREYEKLRASWTFVDARPNGSSTIGFREGEFSQDFSQIVTDALVWGGSALAKPGENLETSEGIGVVFARYPDYPISTQTWHGRKQKAKREQQAFDRQAQYGRWQMGEMNVGAENYLSKGSVKNRAYVIINGPPGEVPTHGNEGGWNRPLDRMRCVWFGHDVPGGNHIRPGYIQDFILYTQGPDAAHPLITSLPMRSISVTFPTLPSDNPTHANKTYVRFEGEFGTSFSDSRHLWRYLIRASKRRGRGGQITSLVTNASENAAPGSLATLTPVEKPNGTRKVFTFTYTFYNDSMELYLNALRQRLNLDYRWDAEDGKVRFFTAPDAGDQIYALGYVSE